MHLTRNSTVMLSWHAAKGLRIHAGYAAAPDDVLRAVVRFVARRVPRAERLAARRTFMAFPVHQHEPVRPARSRRSRPVSSADQEVIDRLVQEHAAFNAKHFGGELGEILITLSNRMRRRLGELRAAPGGAPVEIVLSRRHIARDGWPLALDTLLHEMVHQWQAENGLALDHGHDFRRKARAVGIVPRAVADLTR